MSTERSALLDRALGYFVEPRAELTVPAPAAVRPDAPSRAAVVGTPADAPPVAAALAAALRARDGAASAVVALWSPGADPSPPCLDAPLRLAGPATSVTDGAEGGWAGDARDAGGALPGPPLPASPAARRLAAWLAARGLCATARGRLAWLRLDAHPVAAALAVRRTYAALDAPLVLALAGAQPDALGALLGGQDLVVVVTPDPDGPLARLAVAALDTPGVACPPLRGPARVAALGGLAGSARALATSVQAAVRAAR